jgi:hypothetical protein
MFSRFDVATESIRLGSCHVDALHG